MAGHDMFYEPPAARSPAALRHPPQSDLLHRQASRHFEAYGQLPAAGTASASAFYPFDEQSVAAARLDPHLPPPRYAGRISPGAGTAAAWNAASFGQNNALAPLSAAARLKPVSSANSILSAAPGRARSALATTWPDQPPIMMHPQPHGLGLGHSHGHGQVHGHGHGHGLGVGHGHGSATSPFPAIGGPTAAMLPPVRNDGLLDPLGPITIPVNEDELIMTAIVIKNIPFAVKKEQLVQLMTDLRLPLPYAFNYHFDNGVFRGLAFANFTTAEETAVVIETMNHYELQGRKLRVEYKKMLPLAERERIEREKRERRGQLEEQHRPLTQMHNQPSLSSLSSHAPATSPSPLSGRSAKIEYDLNDPQVLQFYSELLLFKGDLARDTLTFPPTLTPQQRRVVHTLSHQMGLMHMSKNIGEQRQVYVFRPQEVLDPSPPMTHLSAAPGHGHASHDSQRRALSRAATTDFSDVRATSYLAGGGSNNNSNNNNSNNTLGRQSSGFLGFLESPGNGGGGGGGGLTAAHNLRPAKSYADIRSYTPSPVPSTASFPAALKTNFSRFGDYGPNSAGASTNPTMTPTTASLSAGGAATTVYTGRDEMGIFNANGSALSHHGNSNAVNGSSSAGLLVNGLSGLGLGPGFGQAGNNGSVSAGGANGGGGGSPRGMRGMMLWDRSSAENVASDGGDGGYASTHLGSGLMASGPAAPGTGTGARSSSGSGSGSGSGTASGSGTGQPNGSGTASVTSTGTATGGNQLPGPIGGHRVFSNAESMHSRDRLQAALPLRQPRGPVPERGPGFGRARTTAAAAAAGTHHGRAGDDVPSPQAGVEIVVE